LPYSFAADGTPERIFLDIPPAASKPPSPAAVVLDGGFASGTGPLPALTVHLRSGGGWWSTEAPRPVSFPLRLPLSAFRAEGSPGPAPKADLVRISLWNRGEAEGVFSLREAAFAASASLAVLRAEESAPGEAAFAEAMAQRLSATLRRAGLAHDVLPESGLSRDALRDRRLLFLPYAPRPSRALRSALRDFAEDGGKLVVFYQSDPDLARLLSCDFGPYRERAVSAFRFDDGDESTPPIVVPHATTSLLPPRPAGDGAGNAATWLDESGGETSIPALVLSPAGAAFAHVPPLPSPQAAWLAAFLAAKYAGIPPPSPLPRPDAASFPAADALPRRAAWCPSLTPPLAATWRKTFEKLATIPLAPDTLFVLLPCPAVPSAATPPRAFDALLRDAERAGVAVHAWVPLFSLDTIPEATRSRLAGERRTLPGHPLWLDPANPANRSSLREGLLSLAKSGVKGFHFDYVRSPDDLPASEETADAITSLVSELSTALRKAAPGVVLSAAVYPTPEAAKARNQRWPEWLEGGLIDFVSPMIYADDPAAFRESLARCLASAPAERLLPGVAVVSDEAQPDAAAFAGELRALAEAGVAGAAYYPLSPVFPLLFDARPAPEGRP